MKEAFSIFFISIFLSGFSQDIHFSQFNGSLLNLSPGYTGMFDGEYRLSAIYRSQWASVPVSYATFNGNAEMKFKPKMKMRDHVGIGLMFNNDKAGAANYGTSQIYLNLSYIYMATKDSSLYLTIGMNTGWCAVGFDFSKMTFDNQWDGLQYNPGTSSRENFNRTSRSYVDFNVGGTVNYVYNKTQHLSYALGVNHLSRPVVALQGNDLSRIDFKFTNVISYRAPINEKVDGIAEALISNQTKYYELIPHLGLKFYFDKPLNKAVSGGICIRTRDAVIVRAGYTYQKLQSGISFDINYSKFTAATNRRGAFEIFVNYVFKNNYNYMARRRACPTFM